MATAYVFWANGFEEVEGIAPVDILRRGEVEVKTVSINDDKQVQTAHGITLKADLTFDQADLDNAQLLVLPGGLPGAAYLRDHEGLRQALVAHAAKRGYIGAICAAPMVLGSLGLLEGRKATCYPGFEVYMTGAEYTHQLVTIDDNIITGEGPAASFAFGYELLRLFKGDEVVKQLQDGMMYSHLMQK